MSLRYTLFSLLAANIPVKVVDCQVSGAARPGSMWSAPALTRGSPAARPCVSRMCHPTSTPSPVYGILPIHQIPISKFLIPCTTNSHTYISPPTAPNELCVSVLSSQLDYKLAEVRSMPSASFISWLSPMGKAQTLEHENKALCNLNITYHSEVISHFLQPCHYPLLPLCLLLLASHVSNYNPALQS